MPTYQYACTACGEQHEAVQSFTDAPLSDCPACGGRLRKVFSAVGVVFKGSGFYKTDSRASKSGSGGKDTGKDTGKDGGTSGGEAAAATRDGASSTAGSAAAKKKDGAPAGSGSSSGSASAPAAKTA